MDKREGNKKKEISTTDSFEQAVAETLEYGKMKLKDPIKEAVDHLNPRYIVRIKTEKDPILEEIDLYREMAEEVDNRYDAYLDAARNREKDHQP